MAPKRRTFGAAATRLRVPLPEIPVSVPPPPVKEPKSPPLTPIGAITAASTRRALDKLLTDYRVTQGQMAELKLVNDGRMLRIEQLAKSAGIEHGVVGSIYTAFKTKKTTRSIKAERLLERGVPMDDIEYATEVKVSREFWTVKGKGEKDGDSE